VAEDLLDHLVVINKGDQFHFSTAVWADERIDFRDFLDELAPLLDGMRGGWYSDRSMTSTSAGSGARTPLRAWPDLPGPDCCTIRSRAPSGNPCRECAGDGRNELLSREDLEVALGLRLRIRERQIMVPLSANPSFSNNRVIFTSRHF